MEPDYNPDFIDKSLIDYGYRFSSRISQDKALLLNESKGLAGIYDIPKRKMSMIWAIEK